MLRRRLALLLFVYVSLEFANPFMPGAVTFEGGAIEAAKVERHRPAAATAAAAPSPARSGPVLAPGRPLHPARPGAVRRWILPSARHEMPSLDPAPLADDH
jgi:hypothetical protein